MGLKEEEAAKVNAIGERLQRPPVCLPACREGVRGREGAQVSLVTYCNVDVRPGCLSVPQAIGSER